MSTICSFLSETDLYGEAMNVWHSGYGTPAGVRKLAIIARGQAIVWTSVSLVSTVLLQTTFSEFGIQIPQFAFSKMNSRMSLQGIGNFVSSSMCWYTYYILI